ncbi:MAG: lipopolysaccharide kinase InaA family protein [Candidatus Altiarchaeota archaeon]|nr:lipopolysaccharide kinase InaA family protein [Candidatus Altiarchaeota archaeon]
MKVMSGGVDQKYIDVALDTLELKKTPSNAREYKREGERFVFSKELDDGERVVVKVIPGKKGIFRNIRYCFRASEAVSEFENLKTLSNMGVTVVAPLATAEVRSFPNVIRGAVIVTKGDLEETALDRMKKTGDIEKKALISSIARFMRGLHQRGVSVDTKLEHFLIEDISRDGDYSFCLLDLEGAVVGKRVSLGEIVRRTYRFFAESQKSLGDKFSVEDMLEFWRQYTHGNPITEGVEDKTFERIMAKTRKMIHSYERVKSRRIRKQWEIPKIE